MWILWLRPGTAAHRRFHDLLDKAGSERVGVPVDEADDVGLIGGCAELTMKPIGSPGATLRRLLYPTNRIVSCSSPH